MSYVPGNPYAHADAAGTSPDWQRYTDVLAHFFTGEDLSVKADLGLEGEIEFREAKDRLGITYPDYVADVGLTVNSGKPPKYIDYQSRRTWRELLRLQALRRRPTGGGA